jgi:SAM-dependent methyltransferase
LSDQPYWRSHRKAFHGGRLAWYGDEPSETFWDDLWRRRLGEHYYADADRGDLRGLDDVVVRHLDRDGRHLEAGCGLGYWVAALAARGYDIVGVESSRDLVGAVRAVRPDLAVRHGDAVALDYPDGHFAGYLSFGVVEHRQEGPEPFLVEARRLLRPGGRLILSVPFVSSLRRIRGRLRLYRGSAGGTPFFQYAFGEAELTGLLRDHGFTIDEVHYQEVQRGLVEEVPLYLRLNRLRGAGVVRRHVVPRIPPRWASHMILVVATRQG